MKSASPFRWVGGKTRLYQNILKYLPEVECVDRYFEPFAGGAAIFFQYGHLCDEAYLNDICQPLVNAYIQMSGKAYSPPYFNLEQSLIEMQYDEVPYDQIKAEFNKLRETEGGVFGTRGAALFIALNHLCFNGVWRENKKGEFNVPVGTDSKGPRSIKTLDFDKLYASSQKLANASFTSASFDPWPFPVEPTSRSVIVYDSPYLDEFSAYSKHGFNLDCHKAQRDQAKKWAERGATVIVCGSNNQNSWDVYGEPTEVVSLARTVGHSKRKQATEALYVFTA